MSRMKKCDAKKMALALGISTKEVLVVTEDMQRMGILKHIKDREWRLFDGREWQPLTI